MQGSVTLSWYSLLVPPSPRPAGSGPSDTSHRDTGVPHLDVDALGEMLRQRRTSAGLSIRKAAEAAGVSFMTLSRVEAGAQPDLATFLHLCAWLHEPPETFFVAAAPRETETPEVILRHLLADPRLERGAASRIASVVQDMYDALARGPVYVPAVACHLRAAAVLRPGVAERLGELLQDMHAKLSELDAEEVL